MEGEDGKEGKKKRMAGRARKGRERRETGEQDRKASRERGHDFWVQGGAGKDFDRQGAKATYKQIQAMYRRHQRQKYRLGWIKHRGGRCIRTEAGQKDNIDIQ